MWCTITHENDVAGSGMLFQDKMEARSGVGKRCGRRSRGMGPAGTRPPRVPPQGASAVSAGGHGRLGLREHAADAVRVPCAGELTARIPQGQGEVYHDRCVGARVMRSRFVIIVWTPSSRQVYY